jgi:PAS domain S-box-containing protein
VESYQEELAQIKTILKNNPKGMTVTDIARKIRINRNSVAKYLDILLISGHVEMVTFGPAKVFFPSTRIPLSALLNFTNDYIIIFDKELKFLKANENFLKFSDLKRSDIIGQSIDILQNTQLPIPELQQNAQRALEGTEFTIEKQYILKDQIYNLRIKYIPTTFDDGEPGVTLLIEDVTERKKTEKKMKRIITEWEITFNALTEMVFIQDTEFSIQKANRSFAEFFHMTPEECIGKKCYNILHGTQSAHSSCPCTQIQQIKKPLTLEFFEPYLNKYLEISVSPILSDDGEIISSVHIIRDKTTQRNSIG